ncbi:MAG: DNA translocase FtsK 4TM domain-containing protein [Ilumatobacteraceae bacterium]
MATWGGKARKTSSARSTGRTGISASRDASRGNSGSSSSRQSSRPSSGTSATSPRSSPRGRIHSQVAEPDPPRPTRRGQRTRAELRSAVDGRENEFIGVALIAGGVLTALAIYFKLAGILGRVVDGSVGWLTGLGRYLIPVALIGIGVALVRKGRSQSRVRLTVGWGAMAAAGLGLLHLARDDSGISSDVDRLKRAGGWLGAIVAVPVRALIGTVGGAVLLLAVGLAGLLLVTDLTVRSLYSHTSRSVGLLTGPLGRAARRAVGDMSTLSSERAPSLDGGSAAPQVYDAEAEEIDDLSPRLPRLRKPQALSAPDALLALPGAGEQAELDLGPGARKGQWSLPPASSLIRSGVQTVNKAEVEARGRTLVDSLNSHGVETKLVGMTVGPTVTRYELELGNGVKVARVTSLNRDIAYAMAAIDVRILAPIPGRSAIGVEVPNHTRQLVSLGDIMMSAEAKTAAHPLDVAIGKDIAGRSVFLNLGTTPHLLIAGATGAGKSSAINCIITSLLMRSTPDQVKLILIDPKQVEMGQYNRLPHLLTQPVTNPKKAANALQWACKEMDRRYDVLFEVGFRDIGGYNAAFDRGDLQPEPGCTDQRERMTYIIVVVDELNDLMMVAARDVEDSITRIAQKARAVGIHLIIATQRPSVNVITGVIKANVPARMSFAVSSLTDSRVILDQPGAEKLVGKGDMLLLPGNSNVAQRIQGSFVSEEEVRKIVGHWRRQAPEVTYVSGVEGDENSGAGSGLFGPGSANSSSSNGSSGGDDDDEDLTRQAMELVVRSQLGSTSMLQRKLKVGFARAGRIMDLLEQGGIVGPSEGSKARSVLMTVEEFELLQENGANTDR